MTPQPTLSRGPTRTKNNRNIVDPIVWETTEVGGPEGLALHGKSTTRSKVSSLRSSLFQKNAKKVTEPCDHQMESHHDTLVFQQAGDVQCLPAVKLDVNSSRIAYCEYGKPNKKMWPKDVFAFFHNALRCELIDLISILESLHSLGARLTVRHLAYTRSWWQTCSALLLDYLDMEVKYIEPWVAIGLDENSGEIELAMTLFQAMPQRQQELRDKFVLISKAFGDICDFETVADSSKSNATMMPANVKTLAEKTVQLLRNLETCVTEMASYMHEQEEVFTPALIEAYKSEKKDKELLMGKAIRHFMKKGRKGEFMLVLLTRWMEDAKVARSHVRMIQEWHDCVYITMVTQFENTHANIVHLLDELQES